MEYIKTTLLGLFALIFMMSVIPLIILMILGPCMLVAHFHNYWYLLLYVPIWSVIAYDFGKTIGGFVKGTIR